MTQNRMPKILFTEDTYHTAFRDGMTKLSYNEQDIHGITDLTRTMANKGLEAELEDMIFIFRAIHQPHQEPHYFEKPDHARFVPLGQLYKAQAPGIETIEKHTIERTGQPILELQPRRLAGTMSGVLAKAILDPSSQEVHGNSIGGWLRHAGHALSSATLKRQVIIDKAEDSYPRALYFETRQENNQRAQWHPNGR